MSNYGGGPLSIELKEYKYDDGQNIELLPDCKRVTPEFTFGGGTFHENSLVYEPSHPGSIPYDLSHCSY